MTAPDHPQRCPPAEILHGLVERTLSPHATAEVIAHLDVCRDCRFIVAGTLAFIQQDFTVVPELPHSRRWWLAAAAAVVAVALLPLHMAREPGRRFDRAVRQTVVRPVEGRLSSMPYQSYVARRGKSPPLPGRLAALADAVLSGSPADARDWHRRGLASLLKGDTTNAVRSLERSTQLAPGAARYWSDLAAARLAMGMEGGVENMLAAATEDAAIAVRLEPSLQEGVFNLAVAYQRRGLRRDAAAAFDRYLALDSESLWAAEARRRRETVWY